MAATETKNTLVYLLGIFLLLGVLFFAVVQFGNNGFGLLSDDSGKTYANPPQNVLVTGKDYQAKIKTNLGDITIDLYEKNAPVTVNNFVFLAQDHFYDKVKFHRVVKDFIIQSGSRLSLDSNSQNDGLGGPGYKFADENNWDSIKLDADSRKTLSDQGYKSDPNVASMPIEKYSIAMANAGPDTNGSQFFFVTGATDTDNVKALRGKHTVFGKIISGQDVADKINNVEVLDAQSSSPRPKNDVVITSVEIIVK